MASLDDACVSSDDVGSSINEEEGFTKHIREYDNFRSFINEEELNSEMGNTTLHGLSSYIAKNFESWKDKKLIVGVTGKTGAGKSSLINALRGLKPRDKGAAAVGVSETTKTIQSYPYPGHDHVILKDYPGIGTQDFSKDDYMEKTKLLDSSVIVIVSSERFTENDLWIAKKAMEVHRNVLFVRTKIDTDLRNSREDDPDNFSEYTCMKIIRTGIESNIDKGKLDLQNYRDVIYLITSRDKTKYDFVSLVDKLKSLLSMKVKALCYLLYVHMEKTIKSKTETVEKEFIGRKVASVVTGFLPIPKLESTLDTYHVTKIFETCRERYCIDKASLKQFAEEVDMSEKDIENQLKSYSKEISDAKQLYSETEEMKWSFFEKYSKYTFPGLGMLYSAHKSPRTMQECLEKICKVMAEDELVLIKLRLRKLERDLMTN
ncbi:T-cell-specific guanine nucleotide triphosphate-binding protein 2-like [Mercenaria mercenaria]|uniref:T-cell-specific guanine nucleotide triphosphate-binding protein 2-like n=1 Tax=Mercenaria mercenaria TaxID=6596 RepID=UPI00234E9075|nr:T-cell-specific guanine nucleotide triphosphate-binding protein 2-like [Mercenaria mercenaria]